MKFETLNAVFNFFSFCDSLLQQTPHPKFGKAKQLKEQFEEANKQGKKRQSQSDTESTSADGAVPIFDRFRNPSGQSTVSVSSIGSTASTSASTSEGPPAVGSYASLAQFDLQEWLRGGGFGVGKAHLQRLIPDMFKRQTEHRVGCLVHRLTLDSGLDKLSY